MEGESRVRFDQLDAKIRRARAAAASGAITLPITEANVTGLVTDLATKFTQNGNSFGADAVLGTNDGYNLKLERNNTEVADWSDTRVKLATDYKLFMGTNAGLIAGESVALLKTSGIASMVMQSTDAASGSIYAAKSDEGHHTEYGIHNTTNVSSSTPIPSGSGALGITQAGGISGTARAFWMYNDFNEDLVFATNQTRRMTVYRGGQLLINSTAPNASEILRVNGDVTINTMTAGCVPFFGTNGLISQRVTELAWDDTNRDLTAYKVVCGKHPSVSTIGRIKHSSWGSTDYALAMGAAGYTILNALTGQLLALGINDTYYLQCSAGQWACGTSYATPGRQFDILDASAPQLRLTQASASKYADFQMASSGTLSIAVTGGTPAISLPNINTGFFGATPAARASAYTITNVTTDRAYDADATTIDEIADTLGTLIADLKTYGLLQ